MDDIVTFSHVSKLYKEQQALQDLSFTLRKGETTAILGGNGAGKTTAISLMLGLMTPTSGEVTLFGHTPNARGVKERLGAMLQDVSVMDGLKVGELLQLFRSYYSAPLSFERLMTLTGLTPNDLKRRVEKLSGGQKRRVNFALALAGNPELLFFDEPTVGMDVTARRLFWQTINALQQQGKTIVFTTHYLQEADEVADRLLLFKQGTLIADGSVATIKGSLALHVISFIPGSGITCSMCAELPTVKDVQEDDGRIILKVENSDRVLQALFEKQWNVNGILVSQGSLDVAFETLTKGEAI
ncbi:ABC transporter, ATP-binding protein [Fictibacillus macauensis ZFHKF-1]|uniref:ABC transporter, ATP-binding protein n=1 Tax=Fictibacillus macauensis ZFHKF-1 TaxID=1196324 RepID=I8ALB5_9BACL|nr:ABC transporter ATP-binding protein [Fictibacillus macauensis]EIT86409.1 ABC transporter, ATP-binding protein [Fictibacillus macauensis ZFHKF-1]